MVLKNNFMEIKTNLICIHTSFFCLFIYFFFTEPLGYYFRSEGDQNLYGMLVHRYPYLETETDEIVMGVMTEEKNAVLTKLLSGLFDDYIEIKLVSGLV